MCEECQKNPCDPHCPNAVSEPEAICKICGNRRYADEITAGVCERCARSAFTFAWGQLFVSEDYPAYFGWRFSVEIKGHPNEKTLTALCVKIVFTDRAFDSREQQAYEESVLREYCMEDSRKWAEFVKEQENGTKKFDENDADECRQ